MEQVEKDLTNKKLKVEKYNLVDCKAILDDALRKVLVEGMEFKQNHWHTDIKLVLGYTSALIAGFAAWYNWRKSFQESRVVLITCVVLYSLLNGFMHLFTMFVEKEIVFVGTRNEKTLTISSRLKQHDPHYKLNLVYSPSKPSSSGKMSPKSPVLSQGSREYKQRIDRWFDDEGGFCADVFCRDISGLLVDEKFD